MDSNDLNRRIRYALSLDDASVVDLMRLSTYQANAEQVRTWRLKENDDEYAPCPPEALRALLDGLIVQNRGIRDEQNAKKLTERREKSIGAAIVDNNEVLKQLRIAMTLKTDDVQTLIIAGGGKVTKSEINALFRKPEARNYRRCGDQVLRWFLTGLAKRRNEKAS